jgi:hypothetical protein
MGDWMNRAFASIKSETDNATGVKALRAAMMQDGKLDANEARQLISIHKSGGPPSDHADWPEFLVEAISDYFALSREVPVYHADELKPDWARAVYRAADAFLLDSLANVKEPATYSERLEAQGVSESDAAVLIDAISANGNILDATEIKLLGALFSRAVTYPKALRTFAWQALEATVMADKKIGDGEVDLIRSMVMGPASLEGVAVSQSEAEALCVMDAAIDDASKSAAWPAFFAQAVGSYLLYAGGSPGRLDGTEQAWLDSKTSVKTTLGTHALLAFVAKWNGQT